MDGKEGLSPQAILQVLAVVAVLGLAYYLYSSSMEQPGNEATSSSPEFAECITNSGAVFYGTSWCSHCNAQKELFGDTIEEIEFVDCDLNKDLCSMAGVTAYPTWIINGEKHLGTQPLQTLAQLTECTLNA